MDVRSMYRLGHKPDESRFLLLEEFNYLVILRLVIPSYNTKLILN
jgi:hypothetical protein